MTPPLKNPGYAPDQLISVYHFEHVEALPHNCAVSYKQIGDFHSGPSCSKLG